MILFNGWINILNTLDGEETPSDREKILLEIEELIEPMKLMNQYFELKNFNGSHYLYIGGEHNRDNGFSVSISKLLVQIGRIAKGSYGLIYFRWPDDNDIYNKFHVYKLAKGLLTIEEDSFLSPCNPIIED